MSDAEAEAEAEPEPQAEAEVESEAELEAEPEAKLEADGGDAEPEHDTEDQDAAVVAQEEADELDNIGNFAREIAGPKQRRQMAMLAQTNDQLKKIVEYSHDLVSDVVGKLKDDLIRLHPVVLHHEY
jgi:hypothetical protein